METNRIDFVPVDNHDRVDLCITEWLQDHAFMGLSREPSKSHWLRHSIDIGGTLRAPDGQAFDTKVTVYVASNRYDSDCTVEDPEGTRWLRSAFHAEVSWPSWSSSSSYVAQRRSEIIAAACELARRFDEAFRGVVAWKNLSTREERRARELERQGRHTREALPGMVSDLTRTSCTRMRVGDQRLVSLPRTDLVAGTYEGVETHRKAYEVYIGPRREYESHTDIILTRVK